MLVRICLFVCTWYVCGILLVSATPIHQGINKPAKIADNVQPLEKSTTEPTKSNNEAVESDITDDPLSDTDEKGADNQSKSENESDSGSDDETSTESDDEDYVPRPESNDSDDGSESESRDETDLKTSESAKDEGSEKRKIKNSVDNGSGKKSDSGEPSSDSEGDEVIETDDLKPENEVDLSTIQYNGVNLRVYKYQKNEEGLICHELKRQDKILDNRCLTLQPYVPNAEGVFVSVFNKFIDGQDFICQEIISNVRGLLQVLCASKGEHFYHESPVLHASSSYTGLVDINIPYY